MPGEGMARHWAACTLFENGRNSFMIDRCAERHISSGKAFGHGHDVGRDPIVSQRSPGSAAASTAHYFIGNHEHAMPIADLSHEPRVAIWGRHDAASRANDWLENECRHVSCAKA